MAPLKFFVSAKKRNLAPIYIRLSLGRGCDLIVKSNLLVSPDRWSNAKHTIKPRIRTDADNNLMRNIDGLASHINGALQTLYGKPTKEWLTARIDDFFNIRTDDNTLNSFIAKFLKDAGSGERKNKGGVNFSPGTVRSYEGFQRIFNEYQGIYTEDRIEELKEEKKSIRPVRLLDFEDITVDFYNSFVVFLSNEGYQVNTIGRFIKILKYLMQKALSEKKHKNREFMEGAFSGFTEESFTVYLTEEEVEKIYRYNLSNFPRIELSRDAFICLCETALRISDYPRIEINIRERNNKRYIHIQQSKTGDTVVIPLTNRMEEILKKYNGSLPRISEVYVNKYIKTVASWCGINEKLHWTAQKYGKKYPKSAKKYELISCHTGRRTACTLMYLSGIPAIDIKKISGHKSEKSFLLYIRVTSEETAERLSSLPYFSKNKSIAG